MSPKTPQEALFASEEAEAMPTESIRPERTQTAVMAVILNLGSSLFFSSVKFGVGDFCNIYCKRGWDKTKGSDPSTTIFSIRS